MEIILDNIKLTNDFYEISEVSGECSYSDLCLLAS